MKKRRFLSYFTLLLSCFYFIGLTTSCMDGTNRKEIKIGAILPLTGNIAFLGEPVKKALDLYVDENKEEFEKRGYSLSIVYGDTKGNAKDAVSIANKMSTIDKVNIFLPFLTNVCQAIIPVAEKNDIFTLALSTYPPIVQNNIAFKLFYDFANESIVLTDYLFSKGIKKTLIFGSNDAASKYQFDYYLSKDLKNKNIDFKYVEFGVGEKDFEKIIPKDLNDFDSYLLIGFGSDFPPLLEVMHKYGVLNSDKPVVCGIGGFEINENTPVELVKNLIFAIPDYLLSNGDKYIEFKKKYTQKYQTENSSFMAVFAFDNMIALHELIKKDVTIDFNKGSDVKEKMIGLGSFIGLTGKIVIRPDGQSEVGIALAKFDGSYDRIISAEIQN